MPRYCVFLTTCLPVLMFCNKICNCVKKKKRLYFHGLSLCITYQSIFFMLTLCKSAGNLLSYSFVKWWMVILLQAEIRRWVHCDYKGMDMISDNIQAVVFKCPQLILAGKCLTPTTTQHSKSLESLLFHILMLELQQVTITSSTCLNAGVSNSSPWGPVSWNLCVPAATHMNKLGH